MSVTWGVALTPSEAIPIPGRAPLAWVQPRGAYVQNPPFVEPGPDGAICSTHQRARFRPGRVQSSISGVVADTGGGVIPGATVTATNEATAGKSTAVLGRERHVHDSGLIVGSYTVKSSCRDSRTPCSRMSL